MRKLLLLTLLAAAAPASEASAHAALLRAEPRVGATLRAPPAELRLWFSERIELAFTRVGVIDAGGRPVPLGPLRLAPADGRQAVAPFLGPLAPGAYRVEWRALSVDSHRTEGDFGFTLRGP